MTNKNCNLIFQHKEKIIKRIIDFKNESIYKPEFKKNLKDGD
jgi:hypothetical protein